MPLEQPRHTVRSARFATQKLRTMRQKSIVQLKPAYETEEIVTILYTFYNIHVHYEYNKCIHSKGGVEHKDKNLVFHLGSGQIIQRL